MGRMVSSSVRTASALRAPAADYEPASHKSIQNTLRQALFLPTSRESKYKAKAAIDTFFTRVGDVISAGAVALGQLTGFTVAVFASINVGLTIAWLGVAALIARE